MPGYGGTGQAALLRENQQEYLFVRESNLVGTASIAVQLERLRNYYLSSVSFQLYFTDANGNPASPGAFEVDIQSSDIDQDTQYCLEASLSSTALNANFVGRMEFPALSAKYVRAFVKTLPNAVYTSLLVTH